MKTKKFDCVQMKRLAQRKSASKRRPSPESKSYGSGRNARSTYVNGRRRSQSAALSGLICLKHKIRCNSLNT